MVKFVKKERSGVPDSDPAPNRGRNRQAAAAWKWVEDDSSSGEDAGDVPGRPKAAAAAAGPVRPRVRAPAAPAATAAGQPPPARAPAPPPASGVMAWFVSDVSSSESDAEEDEVSDDQQTESNDNPETGGNGDHETECIELLDDDEDDDIEAIEILSSDLEDDDVVFQGVTYFEKAGSSGPQQPVQPPLYQVGHVSPIGSLHAPAAAAAARSHAGAAASAALAAKLRSAAAAAAAAAAGSSCAAAAAAAAAAAVPLPDDSPPRKKLRRCSVLDLCGSEVVAYQEELASQRDVYNMYVDGSHRPHWPSTLQMSAGGFARCPPHCAQRTATWFNFSLLLVGGARGSMPAELGAIYIGCAKLQQAIAAGTLDAASSEVHMHTDCQGAANMLKRKGARVPKGLGPLISGIKARLKQLKQHMPVRLRWVKGHQKGAPTEHGSGNDQAHNRAQPNSLEGAEQMPTGPRGEVEPDEVGLKAVWDLFVVVRNDVKQQRKFRHKEEKVSQLLHAQLKRSGKKGKKLPKLLKRLTAASKASDRHQARQQGPQHRAQGARAGGAMLDAAGAGGPPPAAAAAAGNSALLHQQMLMHTATAAGAAPFVFSGLQYTPAALPPAAAAAAAAPRSHPIAWGAPASGAGAVPAPGPHLQAQPQAQPPAPLLLGTSGPMWARSHSVPPWQRQQLKPGSVAAAAAAGLSTVPGAAAAAGPSALPGAAAAAGGGPTSLPGAAAAAGPSTLPGSSAAAVNTLYVGAAALRPNSLPSGAATATTVARSTLLSDRQQSQLEACELLPPPSSDSSPAASSENAVATAPKPAAVGVCAEPVQVICIDC